MLRAHYDIIYRNVIKRSENSLMDLNCFFDALEELGAKIYKRKDPYENLREIVETVIA